ncbi:MAG: C-GCAxxG-C-C family protein [Dehalococcoidia bacterium]|nr:C-GCAxxG-C-C family protein [Dehalococcoidia bacterium]
MTIDIINLQAVKSEAAELYRSGDYYCSEAIISTIRKYFAPDMPEQAIAMGSGFPVGMGGSMCTCGAVVGGIIALGYFFGRVRPKDTKVQKAMTLAKELHDYFRNKHKVLCCKILTKGMELGSPVHMEQCIAFTGEIAEKTAEIIARELGIAIERQ